MKDRSTFVEIFMVGSVKLFYLCKSDVSAVHGHSRSLILVPIESGMRLPISLSE